MSRIEETLEIKLPDNSVIEVFHHGIKPYNEWTEEAKKELAEWVAEGIAKGLKEDWIPFANFEASARWSIGNNN